MKSIYGMIGLLCLCSVSVIAGKHKVLATDPVRHTVVNASEVAGTQVSDASQGIYKHTPLDVVAQESQTDQSSAVSEPAAAKVYFTIETVTDQTEMASEQELEWINHDAAEIYNLYSNKHDGILYKSYRFAAKKMYAAPTRKNINTLSRINKIMVSCAYDRQQQKVLTQSLKNTDTTDANAIIRIFLAE